MGRSLSRRRLSRMAAVAVVSCGLLVSTPGVSAAALDATFEVDGDLVDDAAAAPDWQSLFTTTTGPGDPAPTRLPELPQGFTEAKFFRDFAAGSTADGTTYATGSKDTLDITPGWQCKRSNNVTDKGDIQNTYMTVLRDANDQTIVYAGLEKNASNGNNNMAIWLLKDSSVACTSGSGNTPFTGRHENGDVLLVAAFLGGGSNPVIDAYEWRNGAVVSKGSGGKCGTGSSPNLCAITNDTTSVSTSWTTNDKVLGTGTQLQSDQFYEMGANLTALGLNECFATYVANTRSSQELGATLYDFAGGSAPTCGTLGVRKYLDVNTSGSRDSAPGAADVQTGSPVAGWSFAITGPNGLSCTGTTTSTAGAVETVNCSASTSTADQARTGLTNMPQGTYTVTETQQSGFFSTDPGPVPNGAATVSKTVTLSAAGGTVDFGNNCYVTKTFEVTGVPSGQSGLFAYYTITAGPGASSTVHKVPLAQVGTTSTYRSVLSSTFIPTHVIDWGYGTGLSTTSEQSVAAGSGESFAQNTYPSCAKTNSTPFATKTVTGSKYKDVNDNGTLDAGEPPLAGFTFDLFTGSATSGTPFRTGTSAADGTYSFPNVPPGSYTVVERPRTHWVQTLPTSGGRPVTVLLSSPSVVTVLPFLNAPLANFGVTFDDLTESSYADIACVDGAGNAVGVPNTTSTTAGDRSYTGTGIRVSSGTITCTIDMVDP